MKKMIQKMACIFFAVLIMQSRAYSQNVGSFNISTPYPALVANGASGSVTITFTATYERLSVTDGQGNSVPDPNAVITLNLIAFNYTSGGSGFTQQNIGTVIVKASDFGSSDPYDLTKTSNFTVAYNVLKQWTWIGYTWTSNTWTNPQGPFGQFTDPIIVPPVISSPLTANVLANTPFTYHITTAVPYQSEDAPSSYNATGLPAGLTQSNGTISGTPTTPGTYNVTISATNQAGTGSATLRITVGIPAPVISSASNASVQVGLPFSYTITASYSPTSYSAINLPAGLILNTGTGVISGTIANAGTYTVTIGATNSGGTGTKTLSISCYVPCSATPVIATYEVTGNSIYLVFYTVPGATKYNINFQVQGTSNNTLVQNVVLGSSNQYTFTGAYNTTYVVTAQGICSAGLTSAWSSPTGYNAVITTSANPCNLATPVISTVEPSSGRIWVVGYPVTGASSYNVKFVNGSITIPYNNVATTLTTSGLSFNVTAGATYQVYFQANCSAGGTSLWSAATTASARPAISQSSAGAITNVFTLYSVRSSSQVNAFYNANHNGKADILIFDELGATVMHKTFGIAAGQNNYPLNVSQLINGVYFVKLIDGTNTNVQKLVIQK